MERVFQAQEAELKLSGQWSPVGAEYNLQSGREPAKVDTADPGLHHLETSSKKHRF